MDNDLLFVCFSTNAIAPSADAPLNEGIEKFAATIDRVGFRQFYEERCRWHWYPIVSAGFSSFPTHGDLVGELSEQQIHECIGYAAEICWEEDGKRFVSALGLLSLLCRSSEQPKEVQQLSEHFMKIRERVTANEIDSNIPYWFSKVALFQIATGAVPRGYRGSFDRAGMNAPKHPLKPIDARKESALSPVAQSHESKRIG
jgi:hypothetical protein